MRTRLTFSSLLLLACAACTTEPQIVENEYIVTFAAQSLEGDAIESVNLTAGSQKLGSTNEKGELRAVLRGAEGATVHVAAECPKGFVATTPDLTVSLRQVTSVDDGQAERGALVSVECRPTETKAAVVIRTEGLPKGVGVLVHGERVAELDEHGVAHAQLSMAPNSDFRVTLDTSALPKTLPASPSFDFSLKDKDEYYLINQAFAEMAVKKKVAHSRKKSVVEAEPERPEELQ